MKQKYSKIPKTKKLAYLKLLDKTFANFLGYNNPTSELQKQYKNSYFCSNTYRENEGSLQTSYCKTRWCRTCSRILTAKLMNQYIPQFEKYENLYMLTLTTKTVERNELTKRLSDMSKIWNGIRKKSISPYGIEINGVRKLEINPTHDKKYHPHFHVLITSENQAKYIQSEWLNRWKKKYPKQRLVSIKANKYFKIPHTDLIEMFKYSTKLITKNTLNQKDKLNREVVADPQTYDTIFTILKGKRTFQNFGNIKADKSKYIPTEKTPVPKGKIDNLWTHSIHDWLSVNGEKLTDYTPSKETNDFLSQMENKKS